MSNLSLNPIPNPGDSKREATQRNLKPIIENLQPRGYGARQVPTVFSRVAIVGGSEPHPVLGGLLKNGKLYPVNPNFDPTKTNAGLHVDDNFSNATFEGGVMLVDFNHLPDRNVAVYLGPNGSYEVYGVVRTPRHFIITAATSVNDNIWHYTGKEARLKESPFEEASPWEAHPDAVAVALFNLRESGNTAAAAYNGEVSFDTSFTGISPIPVGRVVTAMPKGYPKTTAGQAGEVWYFSAENKPTVSCPPSTLIE